MRPADKTVPWRQSLYWLLSFVRPYRWQLFLGTLCGVLKYNLPVFFPWLLKEFVDCVVAGRQTSLGISTDALMGAAVVLFLAYGFVVYLRTHFADRLAHKVMCDIQRDVHAHIMRLPMSYFQSNQVGMLTSRLVTDAMMAQNFIGLAGINFLMEISSVLAITCMIVSMNAKLAIIALSSLPIYILMHKLLGNQNRSKALLLRARAEELESHLHESLQGVADTKSYTGESRETERVSERCERLKMAAYDRIHSGASLLASTAILTRIPTVLVIWYGGYLVRSGELTVGQLLAFYAYLELIYNPLTRLSDLNVLLANSLAAIERLFQLRSEKTESNPPNAPKLEIRHGKIQFENVSFQYDDVPILREFNLSIAAGECVALIGPSGAGKSTLIKLLERFHDPIEGQILIDDQPVDGVDLTSLRSNIAVVHQDVFLFNASIEENIRFGNETASGADVIQAAKLANAWEFISSLPQGMNSLVGERGGRLSGGQKQRISLARAFLKNAPILVFDESTSNLDNATEKEVCTAIQRLRLGRTTLIVSHRLSAIEGVDRIIELKQGKSADKSFQVNPENHTTSSVQVESVVYSEGR